MFRIALCTVVLRLRPLIIYAANIPMITCFYITTAAAVTIDRLLPLYLNLTAYITDLLLLHFRWQLSILLQVFAPFFPFDACRTTPLVSLLNIGGF